MEMFISTSKELVLYNLKHCGAGSDKCIGPQCAKWRYVTTQRKTEVKDLTRTVTKVMLCKEENYKWKSLEDWSPEFPDFEPLNSEWEEVERVKLPSDEIEKALVYLCRWIAKEATVKYPEVESGYCGEAGFPKERNATLI